MSYRVRDFESMLTGSHFVPRVKLICFSVILVDFCRLVYNI